MPQQLARGVASEETPTAARPDHLRPLLAGALLAAVAALAVLLADALALDLDAVVLLGVALGAVVVLVPDASPTPRLLAAVLGAGVVWVAYLLRAAVLPDSPGGRAVFTALVLLALGGLAAFTASRLPLWALLVGAAAFAGAYEKAFAAAPPLVLDTSVTAATTLALAAAVGVLAAQLFPVLPSQGSDQTTPGVTR